MGHGGNKEKLTKDDYSQYRDVLSHLQEKCQELYSTVIFSKATAQRINDIIDTVEVIEGYIAADSFKAKYGNAWELLEMLKKGEIKLDSIQGTIGCVLDGIDAWIEELKEVCLEKGRETPSKRQIFLKSLSHKTGSENMRQEGSKGVVISKGIRTSHGFIQGG